MSNLGDMIWRNMEAIGQEEKETCIHCNNKWYSIHFRDGVCHQCQQLGRPGRTVLAARKRKLHRTAAVIILIISFLIVWALFS